MSSLNGVVSFLTYTFSVSIVVLGYLFFTQNRDSTVFPFIRLKVVKTSRLITFRFDLANVYLFFSEGLTSPSLPSPLQFTLPQVDGNERNLYFLRYSDPYVHRRSSSITRSYICSQILMYLDLSRLLDSFRLFLIRGLDDLFSGEDDCRTKTNIITDSSLRLARKV